MVTPISDTNDEPAVRGFLHAPATPNGNGFVLSHGAGSNCESKLLVALANALENVGFAVLRIDLPFRQLRPHSPPFPSMAAKDREGIRRALKLMRSTANGRIFAGGHSYGGRQTSMLLAEDPQAADGLLLLSYPLHPPGKPEHLRTAHFPSVRTPTLFVHGTRDPFASSEELRAAVELLPATHEIMEVENAGHDLMLNRKTGDLPESTARQFLSFIESNRSA